MTVCIIGVPLAFVCRCICRVAFPLDPLAAWTTGAVVLLMPLTLLYVCHLNPDGMVLLLTSLGFLLSIRALGGAVSLRQAAALGAVCGLAALTKLSAAPAAAVAAAALWWSPPPGGKPVRAHRLSRVGTMALAFLVVCGWWYARNAVEHGTPFIHTARRFGTGFQTFLMSEPTGMARTVLLPLK